MIRSALESPDSSAPNSGSNFVIRPLEVDLVTFESAELPNKWKFLWFFCQLILLLMFQLNDFKSDEIGSKRSDYDVWHLVGCASVRALQRTSNQQFPTNSRPCGTLFMKKLQKKEQKKTLILVNNFSFLEKWNYFCWHHRWSFYDKYGPISFPNTKNKISEGRSSYSGIRDIDDFSA